MLVILKIPIVYLGGVIWWAVRAEPLPEDPTTAVEVRVEPLTPAPTHAPRANGRRPRSGGPVRRPRPRGGVRARAGAHR
jgi:hypothetical protein